MMMLSALPSASGSAYMSPWRRLDEIPAASSFTRARRSISDERSMPVAWLARPANSSIMRPVPVPISTSRPRLRRPERPLDRPLDVALGDVERADLVPHLSVGGEIAVRGFGALGADRLRCAQRRLRTRRWSTVRPGIEKREQWLRPLRPGKRDEHPASLLAAVENAGVAENLQVAGDARLALAEDLCELSDGELHDAQQGDDPQPGGIGKRLEAVGERESVGH